DAAWRRDRAVQVLAEQIAGWRRADLADLPEHEWRAAGQAGGGNPPGGGAGGGAGGGGGGGARGGGGAGRGRRGGGAAAGRAAVLRAAGLGAAGREVYDRLLAAVCEQVVLTLQAVPSFGAETQARRPGDVREPGRAIDGLPGRLNHDGVADREFTGRYLEHVV